MKFTNCRTEKEEKLPVTLLKALSKAFTAVEKHMHKHYVEDDEYKSVMDWQLWYDGKLKIVVSVPPTAKETEKIAGGRQWIGFLEGYKDKEVTVPTKVSQEFEKGMDAVAAFAKKKHPGLTHNLYYGGAPPPLTITFYQNKQEVLVYDIASDKD